MQKLSKSDKHFSNEKIVIINLKNVADNDHDVDDDFHDDLYNDENRKSNPDIREFLPMRESSKGSKRDAKIKRTLENDKDGEEVDDVDDVVGDQNNHEERNKMKKH